MHDIEILRADHVGIGWIADRLALMVDRPAPVKSLDLFQVRGELRRALLNHLAQEDWVIYPRLLASNRADVRVLAASLADGAAAFTAAFKMYSRRWTAESITADWQGFRKETLAILDALKRRISFEDNELYPLVAERSNRAA